MEIIFYVWLVGTVVCGFLGGFFIDSEEYHETTIAVFYALCLVWFVVVGIMVGATVRHFYDKVFQK